MGLTITDNELQYKDKVEQSKSVMVNTGFTELQDFVAAEQVVGDDITCQVIVYRDSSEKPSRAKLGALEDNDVDVTILETDNSTRASLKKWLKRATRVRIEAGKHIVREPIAFPHRLPARRPVFRWQPVRPTKDHFKLSDAALEQQLAGFHLCGWGDRVVTFKGELKKVTAIHLPISFSLEPKMARTKMSLPT